MKATRHTDAIRSVEHPFADGEVFVVPPLEPDVALVHAQRADAAGNAHLEGIVGDIVEAVFAAETVVLSVEEVVTEEGFRHDSNHTVPGTEIDYLVEEPFGAHPSYAQGYYSRDNGAYRKWDSVARSHDSTAAWLDEWIYGVRDRTAYLDALGERRPESVSPERSRAEPVVEDDR